MRQADQIIAVDGTLGDRQTCPAGAIGMGLGDPPLSPVWPAALAILFGLIIVVVLPVSGPSPYRRLYFQNDVADRLKQLLDRDD
jgi:hypothetical protein